jgi:hypothetical protein
MLWKGAIIVMFGLVARITLTFFATSMQGYTIKGINFINDIY